MKKTSLGEILLAKMFGAQSDEEDYFIRKYAKAFPGGLHRAAGRLEDAVALALVSALPAAPPSNLLKERVMAATEPRLAKVVTGADCRILSISRGFTELCGFALDEIRGKKPGSFLQGAETDPSAVERLREAIRKQEPRVVELVNYHKLGSKYVVRIDLRPVFGRRGELEGYTATEEKIG